jgi:chain length determinant protein (polysaccharide antigen chain regulator)
MAKNDIEQLDDEIDLREIIMVIWNRKVFLILISIVFAAIALGYAKSKKTYSNTLSFNMPTNEVVYQVNTYDILDKTKDTIFSNFYQQITNKEVQLQELKKSPLGEKLISKIKNIEEIDIALRGYLSRIKDTSNYIVLKNTQNKFDRNISLTLEGKDYLLQGDFLLKLYSQVNENERNHLLAEFSQKLRKKIKEIDTEIEFLINQERNNRLSKIQRISKSDEEKIETLQLERQRIIDKAKSDRLAKIDRLMEAREMARDLGIIENNFKKINSSNDSTLTLSIGDNQKLPNWYLYGEKALSKEIELLQSRKSDEPFIARVNEIDYEIDKIKNNSELKSLKSRVDDALYVDKIFKLTAEKNKLLTQNIDLDGVDFVTLTKSPIEKTSNSKTLLKVLLGAIVGFIFGLFVILIQSALRTKES